MEKKRRIIGAYRDGKNRLRPITQRTGRQSQTGIPARTKQMSRQADHVSPPEPKVPAEIIANQLRYSHTSFKQRWSVKRMVRVDDNTLRLNVGGKGKLPLNVDIRYDFGTDTYSIKAYQIKKDMAVYEVYEEDGIYAESLSPTLDRLIIGKVYNKYVLIAEGF